MARAARPANAVGVVFNVTRRVVVDHVRDLRHVDAAAEAVGPDDHRDLARLEGTERTLAVALVLVAVHRGRRAAELVEVRLERVGRALGVYEDDGLTGDRLEELDAEEVLEWPST